MWPVPEGDGETFEALYNDPFYFLRQRRGVSPVPIVALCVVVYVMVGVGLCVCVFSSIRRSLIFGVTRHAHKLSL